MKNEEREKEAEKVRNAIAAIAEQECGQIFFRWMMDSCFFTRSVIEADPNVREINPIATAFNESRRRVYLDIRRAIPKALLRKIENT